MNHSVQSTSENLHYLLNPRSLAIIGVSRNPDSFGYPLVEIAQKNGYAGRLYLVNPKADTILGLPCYPSILDIPDEVDAAMIMVPRKFAGQAVEDCVRKGVKGIVMITAGFAEAGEEGRRQQDELVAKARDKGIRIIGPNTLGYYSAPVRLDAIMSGFIKPGHAALISQSGNLTQSLTFPGAQRGLGFRYVVGLGNQADVQAHDLIRYFRDDPDTRVIAVHIEGLRDGRRFMEEVRETVRVKPVVVVKSGRSEKGARVASSHTASIAGNDAVYQAAFRQCGAIPVETFCGLTSALLAFAQGKPMRGRRVCIISEGGGDCAWTSDACVRRRFDVPELSAETQARLKQIIPPNGSVSNPIDLAGWQNFVEATEIVLADDAIDGIILVGGFAGNFHISPRDYDKEKGCVERMCRLLARAAKPVLIYSYSGYKRSPLTDLLAEHGIPLFLDHHDAVEAMAVLARFQEIQSATAGRRFESALPTTERRADSAARAWLETEAKALLRQYDIPFPEERFACNAAEAAALAHEIGLPVALKIVSRDILHKSDAGCVKLNLCRDAEVEQAFAEIMANARRFAPTRTSRGAGQQDGPGAGRRGDHRRPERCDLWSGGHVRARWHLRRDPEGCRVQSLSSGRDRRGRNDPGDQGIPGSGWRGAHRPADLGAIKRALLNVSRLLIAHREIQEVDLNPVKAHVRGLQALDARVIASGGAQ